MLDHSIICPIITTRPQADLLSGPDLHQYLRTAVAVAETLPGADGLEAVRVVIATYYFEHPSTVCKQSIESIYHCGM